MEQGKPEVSIFWFRRDLRIEDNHGLYQALNGGYPVLPIFIFDTEILSKLEDKSDARVSFIHHQLTKINQLLIYRKSSLLVKSGRPIEIWNELLQEYDIKAVYANRDYEPYAIQRDKEVYEFLKSKSIKFSGYKDQLIFEKDQVVKSDGNPYTVFTPYSKIWKKQFHEDMIKPFLSENADNWCQTEPTEMLSLKDIGFERSGISFPSAEIKDKIISDYHKTRDIPSIHGTSRLSVHLRFGTISIRKLVGHAIKQNEKFLNELIWREFYSAILWHFPRIVNENFKKPYDLVEWRNDEDEFEKWKNGMTGYPIVDAGMRELNATGHMHNRVRMIVACFMTKHLLIDWRWGEAYFASKLLDFELASNNGGWQWAAGTGVDAAPYFRVFNPYTQAEKFDPNSNYIKQWVPELGTSKYPMPIVEHKFARQRALDTYKKALAGD
ncbi:MAG: DNA photolyase family protein [bacterium]|nr:DNA photolyase family protein [bacterium]